jgi:hypothetical protein
MICQAMIRVVNRAGFFGFAALPRHSAESLRLSGSTFFYLF